MGLIRVTNSQTPHVSWWVFVTSLLLLASLVPDASKTAAFVRRPHRLETKMHCELTAEGKSGFAP